MIISEILNNSLFFILKSKYLAKLCKKSFHIVLHFVIIQSLIGLILELIKELCDFLSIKERKKGIILCII